MHSARGGMAEDNIRQRIRVELTRLYAAVNETAYTSDVSLEDIQYFSSYMEQFHRHLVRLSENNFVSTECVRLFRDAYQSIRDFHKYRKSGQIRTWTQTVKSHQEDQGYFSQNTSWNFCCH